MHVNIICYKQHFYTVAEVYAIIGVTLTVYGPQANDTSINLCPNQNFVLVVHCSVTDSSSFLWALPPFVDPSVTFIRTHKVGKISRSPVTLVLTEKRLTNRDINSYESQLQVPTSALREAIADKGGSPLVVTCQAGAVQKRMTIHIKGLYIVYTVYTYIIQQLQTVFTLALSIVIL